MGINSILHALLFSVKNMENPIPITFLNDFIFCPASIYFHNLYGDTDRIMYQDSSQINGTFAHSSIDNQTYSTRKSVLQGYEVYSEEWNLIGKIDLFDMDKGLLCERKKKINTIFDGYIFQLYGQYFSLVEMGFVVKEIRLYSLDDNKIYPVALPGQNSEMFQKFKTLIESIENFSLDSFSQNNPEKCRKCIYEPLCCYSFPVSERKELS